MQNLDSNELPLRRVYYIHLTKEAFYRIKFLALAVLSGGIVFALQTDREASKGAETNQTGGEKNTPGAARRATHSKMPLQGTYHWDHSARIIVFILNPADVCA